MHFSPILGLTFSFLVENGKIIPFCNSGFLQFVGRRHSKLCQPCPIWAVVTHLDPDTTSLWYHWGLSVKLYKQNTRGRSKHTISKLRATDSQFKEDALFEKSNWQATVKPSAGNYPIIHNTPNTPLHLRVMRSIFGSLDMTHSLTARSRAALPNWPR